MNVVLSIIAFLIMAFGSASFSPASALSIEGVRLDRTTLQPGGTVNVFYRLTEEARVTLLIYSPDYTVVRRLLDVEKKSAGVNSVSWDGRDQGGQNVPDEAYLVGILAEGPNGQRAVYDPTSFSGGETIDIPVGKIEEVSGEYRIHYSVPCPSRISIRAGIRKGPLLKTVLDSKALPPGDYVQTWDGMDETGKRKVLRERGNMLYIRGFRLPESAIIVQGNGGDYHAYHRNLRSSSPAKKDPLSYQNLKENTVKRLDKEISPQFLVRQTSNVSPAFKVFMSQSPLTGLAEREVTEVSGQFAMVVEVDPEHLRSFGESRYEIVVFVDDQRFDEEEQAYSPYTYMLDTTRLKNGEHRISINLVSLTDQIGSYSFRIRVKN
jgi:hypothetical protein